MKPLILTPGEPAGIGPDLVIQLAQTARNYPAVIAASAELLQQRAAQLKLPLHVSPFVSGQPVEQQAGALTVHDILLSAPSLAAGRPRVPLRSQVPRDRD